MSIPPPRDNGSPRPRAGGGLSPNDGSPQPQGGAYTISPLPCISYANVHNYYGPYAYCSLDKGVACAQHTQLPTHTCAGHMC